MNCPDCAAKIRRGLTECPKCGSWLSDPEPDDPRAGRPSEVRLAVKLLAGAAGFGWFLIVDSWSKLGLEWVSSHRAAWIRPVDLALWSILIALTWLGNSWARTMVLVLIAWHALNTIAGATVLVAIAGSQVLTMLSWTSLAIELLAAYFLLQTSSLEWFRN